MKHRPGSRLWRTFDGSTYVYSLSPGHRSHASRFASRIRSEDRPAELPSFRKTAQLTPSCPLSEMNFRQTKSARASAVISTIFPPGPTNCFILRLWRAVTSSHPIISFLPHSSPPSIFKIHHNAATKTITTIHAAITHRPILPSRLLIRLVLLLHVLRESLHARVFWYMYTTYR
jgi:hypothetical protein